VTRALIRIGRRTAQSVGADKEQLARTYLENRGLRFVGSNYHCRRGEVDLIMRDADTLVFVEVRCRASSRFASPAESVDRHKQRRIAAAAGDYLQHHPTNLACRFDVLCVRAGDQIDWIRHAFDVS
jgi:putative endonuclease